ncbi:TPA: hypothetical protein ACFKWF_08230 [Neisseria gonorrhoeae]|nr:hypothetical protein FNL98_12115 [Neisseria gonorrhoeae]QDM64627.1 hypothetical protein FNL99_12215 [Neisseria gonorrhoeae]
MYPFPTRKPHENVWRINENQDKAAKPRTVRQGEATPYWFKFNSLYIPSFPRGRESGPLVRQMGGRVARLSDKNRV